MHQKLQPKDLITTGVFSALIFAVCFAVAMLGFIPIFIPLMAVLVPLIGGIPFMLFATKVQKFGMVTIMGTLFGLIMGLMGHGVWAFVSGPLFGLLGDLVMKSGGYKSTKKDILGHGVFSMWVIGNFLPIVLSRSAYYDQLVEGGYGVEYADALMKLIPDWSLLPLLLTSFVCGILGGLLGKSMLKKHFVRAGIV